MHYIALSIERGRERRQLARTGTDGITVQNIRLSEIIKDHTNKSKKYIDTVQATMPGMTARKIFNIRERIKLI